MNIHRTSLQSLVPSLKSLFYSLLASIQFLTILPPLTKRRFTSMELGGSLKFFPLVGVIIGFLLVLVDQLFSTVLPGVITDVLVLFFWIIITGALHFDGFLDSIDGLLGGKTIDSRLSIMRDEHVGSYALIGGVLLLLMKFFSLYSIPDFRISTLIIAPTIGRWAMVVCVIGFPYAREQGLGRVMKDYSNWKQAALATLFTLIIVLIFSGGSGIVVLTVAALLTAGLAWISLRMIKGMTGDTYGAVNELVEVLVLVTAVVMETA